VFTILAITVVIRKMLVTCVAPAVIRKPVSSVGRPVARTLTEKFLTLLLLLKNNLRLFNC